MWKALSKAVTPKLWTVFKTAWPYLLVFITLAATYGMGFRWASKQAEEEKAVLMARHTAETEKADAVHTKLMLAAEQEYSAKLKEAVDEKQKWYDFAQAQSVKLADANRKLDVQTAKLKEQIPHVVKQDEKRNGGCIRGLGTDSLQLYNRALGYPDDAG